MKIFFIGIGAIVVVLLVVIFLLPARNGPSISNDPDVVAVGGMHWHPRLTITVGGSPVEIPQDVGIGAVHQPMHTHDDLPIIHLEFPGTVKKDDIRLGRFFEIWGKDMRMFGTNMRMMVNGVENTEYEGYIMRDNDVIELQYD